MEFQKENRERENGADIYFVEIMAENFSKLIKYINPHTLGITSNY